MRALSELAVNEQGVIASIEGDVRFLSRVTSIGLTPGCRVKMLKNDKNRPILVYSRDTMVALNRGECAAILVDASPEAGQERTQEGGLQ